MSDPQTTGPLPAEQVPERSSLAWARIGIPAALALLGAIFFSPGMGAGFVSDSFYYLWTAHNSSLADVLGRFVPSAATWYRPLTDLVFRLEYQLFGQNPVGYHVVALLFHIASAILVYVIALRLTGRKLGALPAGLLFLLAVHAHEVVWDVAVLHGVMGGTLLLGCVLAYMLGRNLAALLLAALTFLVDETGLLLVPILALYELLFHTYAEPAGSGKARFMLRASLARLAPFAVLLAAYVLWRTVITSAGFYIETVPCRSIQCIASGAAEYINRLLWRPDAALNLIWGHRFAFALAALVLLGILSLLLRPWEWRNRRAALFAAGWIAGSVLYYILALWEYISDRFLYIPDMGLGLLAGVACAEALNRRAGEATTRPRNIADAVVAVLFALWLTAGAAMLLGRGALWTQAGDEAHSLVEQVHALVPQPPQNPVFVARNLPDSYYQQIPPGNTGPYLFRNGFDYALRLRYDRNDILAYAEGKVPGYAPGPGRILLSIENGRVAVVSGSK